MSFFPLDVPPGCYRNGTEYQSQGRWYDMAGIRFFTKTVRPVGGWVKLDVGVVDGPGRGMLAWRRNTGVVYCGVGTPDKLWVFDNDTLTDITPDFFEPGVDDTVAGVGFGAGRFGLGPFGVTSGAGSRSAATAWTMAAWGDHLVAMATHDNVAYEWDGVLTNKAEPIENAPTGTSLFVTEQQQLVILGADDDQRLVRYSDVQNNTIWDAGPDNLAGDHKMVTDGILVVGFPSRNGNLILTTIDAHLMEYVGPNQVYRFSRIDTGCGIVGLRAGCVFQNGNVAWMGDGNFFLFDGASVRPIPSDVLDYVFSDINMFQGAKIECKTTQQFGEITWHYPSADSNINNRTVTWNFIEGHWAINGQPARASWHDAGAFEFPLAVNVDGEIFTHENGWTDDGDSRVGQVFCQTGPVEIGNGDQVIYVRQVVPDQISAGAWKVAFATRFAPEGPVWAYGPYTLNEFTDVRLAGRQVAVKLISNLDGDIRAGRFRFDGKAGGGR